jgi:hypothetical protein
MEYYGVDKYWCTSCWCKRVNRHDLLNAGWDHDF